MGVVAGEGLVKWEKMEGVGGCEEKILVLVRLRPLSEKETVVNEVADWECINDTTILYRNTLREGSTFPSAYTFDRVFRGDCSTKQVYEEGAKNIALSVVNGVNSSIFAYGQTSSGKTYTMIGITEYAVADIFDYINKHEERAFVLKFSAIEIYNEIISDLLSTENTPLRLRDDPEKGPVIEKLTEETLRDWVHLKELLSFCEAQRQVGETYLNEKSSRSHQIIRLTIESSAKEFLGKSNSATLAASVNFVDLAGSERASQALSTGSRLKEGCHINRSLLSLGTVIRKLSKGRQGYINYRDSKLTRILQPSLSGNARTAIICTLSPARSHVEQTRNTLLFACYAKEVTVKAQVNVVMSDKALVKQLQKEVDRLESELRIPGPPATNCDCAAMLRKKNLQIEKMEKEIRELTKQRDLAQSRVEDLLRMVGNNQKCGQERVDTWEDDNSVSESSSIYHPHLRIKEYHNPHYNEDSISNPDENADDESCKEVQCVGLEESSRDDLEYPDPSASYNGVSALPLLEVENIIDQEHREGIQNQDNSTYSVHDQRPHDAQLSNESLGCSYPDEQSLQAMSASVSNFRNLKLTRSWSCREHYTTSSSEKEGEIERTPAIDFERCFPGRPDGLRRKFLPLTYDSSSKLSMNGSPSSRGSPSVDELRTDSIRTTASGDITSIQTFVAGMKEMVKLEYEKQFVDDQDQQTEVKTYIKSMKDIGVDPMLEAAGSPLEWTLQFKKQQKEIVELWQTCSVSLFHRTYFFLLFRGDPTDSIYMEVELRRLSFLKGNQTEKGGQTVTLTSSVKGLRRERDVLVKLMQKRLTEEERKNLFKKWGIALDSKRRRMQLVNRLWSNTDIDHITESAAIVAKLVRFKEQGKALKETFGLSFTPQHSRRISHSWKSSRVSLF